MLECVQILTPTNITQNRLVSLEVLEKLFFGNSNCCARYSFLLFSFFAGLYTMYQIFTQLFLEDLLTTMKTRANQ